MKKLLVVGVVGLFICLNITSSTGFNVKEQSPIILYDGKTLYVGGDGPGNYTKIQNAIDDASDGDTVFVYNGTYYENVIVNRTINLIGENKETTIIDGGGVGDVIYISADWDNISNFTIKNGYDAITLYNSKNITISDNYMLSSIDIGYSNTTIINRNIISNIIVYDSNNTNIIGNIISDSGFGILIRNSCNNKIVANDISIHYWGGIDIWYTKNNIIANNIVSNCNWGINITDSCNDIISGNKISNICSHSTLQLVSHNNTSITGNNISGNLGGSCYNLECYNNSYIGNIFSNNTYNLYFSRCSNNTIYHNNFINNIQNAYDIGSNTWDDGYPSGGNYWDDYTGKDNNWDRIGDTPYSIPGDNNSDRYPLMEPYGSEPSPIVGTFGPLCLLLDIAEINILDGNSIQIQKIERILNNRILQFIIPFKTINVTGLNFTISYNRNIPSLWIFYSRLWYTTIIDEDRDIIFYNNSHTVTVEGLDGTFYFYRGRFFNLYPPHFLFAGYCENVTIELHNEEWI